ncbi:hypothetical protein JOC73_000052 [Alkaliphilus hydrothermalis]|uniref:DUF3189 family protein n=1 Tax=Alkaliphilus hydrothermalis TaxID=1482730 RepID=A0ABS2NKS8_9FIRM|nr:DUF3189 family protein [Alkaliphilus hydrothermalis]MBM7613544.1 hypothetical protein [Alkaliphilus hydrothermalis]
MHVIYHCVGGAHSSVLATAIHLNKLPMENKPTVDDILNIPYFDNMTIRDRGKIMFRGTDEMGNCIYNLSRQFVPHLAIPLIEDTWRLLNGHCDDLMIISTLSTVNFLMKLGGFTSRRMNWVRFGRPIVARGSLQAYFDVVKIVEETKTKLRQ